MDWECRDTKRGVSYHAKRDGKEYLVKIAPPGWGLFVRVEGDDRWEQQGTYLSMPAACQAAG